MKSIYTLNCQKSNDIYVNITRVKVITVCQTPPFLLSLISTMLFFPKIITILIAKACFELNTKGIMQHVFFTLGFLG